MTYVRKSVFVYLDYKIDDSIFQRCHVIRDLGIVFDSILSFNDDIDHVIGASSRVRNTKSFHFSEIFILLFCAAQVVIYFYPLYARQIQALKAVQRKFLKFLYYKLERVYPFKGWIELYLQFRINFHVPQCIVRNTTLFYIDTGRINVMVKSPVCIMGENWN